MSTPLKYPLSKQFERFVVYLACSNQKFYGHTGHTLEAEAFNQEESKLAVRAAHAIAQDTGHGPSSTHSVEQRLQRWREEGRVTIEEIQGVLFALDDASYEIPSVEEVEAEVVPILRRRKEHEAVKSAMSDYSNRNDFARTKGILEEASRLGVTDTSIGISLSGDVFAEIDLVQTMDRVGTGIKDLDDAIGGGLWRGALGVAIGCEGSGKSMFLNHVAAAGVRAGLQVAVATLEIPRAHYMMRQIANLTGFPINSLTNGAREKALATMARLQADEKFGCSFVQFFTAHATDVASIKTWVANIEAHTKKPIGMLVIDYADKLTHELRDDHYRGVGRMYEELRVYAVEKNFYVWTASQAQRKTKDSSKVIDTHHASDSIEKVRVADFVVSINPREDGEMELFVAKHRIEEGRKTISVPTDFMCGRFAYIPDQPRAEDTSEENKSGEQLSLDEAPF